MSKYFEALKEYNKGKDKWCMPMKGTDDYKIIIKIIEKNKVIKSSSKVPKEPKVKVPKETKVKVPKEPKVPNVKVPKIPKEQKVSNPKKVVKGPVFL